MINTTCINCKHYEMLRTCPAFKKEIPKEIWNGENDHSKPLKDQENDIVFEEIKKD